MSKKKILAAGITLTMITGLAGCGNETAMAAQAANEKTQATADVQVTETAEGAEQSEETQKGVDPITGEKYPDTIYIGSLNGPLQLGIAIEEGYLQPFEELGVNYEVLYFDSGRDISNAYASKSIDVASFGSSPISLGIAKDLGYEVIYINDVVGSGEGFAVKNDSGIASIEDLAGKKIAAPFASTSHYSLLKAIELGGVDPAEVELLDLQPQDILAAWTRGDIDGAYVWDPVYSELLKDGTSLTDSSTLGKQGAITADLTTANIEFAQKYPTLVTAYVNSFIQVTDLIQNDFDKAVADVAKNRSITTEEAAKQINGMDWVSKEDEVLSQYLGTSDAKGGLADTLKSTADFHVTQGNLEEAQDLSYFRDHVDPSFVERILGQ